MLISSWNLTTCFTLELVETQLFSHCVATQMSHTIDVLLIYQNCCNITTWVQLATDLQVSTSGLSGAQQMSLDVQVCQLVLYQTLVLFGMHYSECISILFIHFQHHEFSLKLQSFMDIHPPNGETCKSQSIDCSYFIHVRLIYSKIITYLITNN